MNLYETWKSLAARAAPGRTQLAFRQYCSCSLSYGTSDFYAALRTCFAMRYVFLQVVPRRCTPGEKPDSAKKLIIFNERDSAAADREAPFAAVHDLPRPAKPASSGPDRRIRLSGPLEAGFA